VLAAFAGGFDADDPMSALRVEDVESGPAPDGWVRVDVRAASLNRHDLFTLQGVAMPGDRLPMILGCDAAGVDEQGRDVVVHAVVNHPDWHGPELEDPRMSLFSELYPGTMAQHVWVPPQNLLPLPAGFDHVQAACLPTAWLTAFRMMFRAGAVTPGQTVLVQGAAGGVATAAILLGRAAGVRVWVTSRSEEKRAWALDLGADAAFEPGARLPEKVDAVMETVGEATWAHSLKSLRKHGTMVVSGGTSGYSAPTEVPRVFMNYLRIQGSTMGSRQDFEDLISFVELNDVRPPVHRTYALADARDAFADLAAGDVRGKLVLTV
jgi:NADPH:quinone reductase-like Zn-dependent oxidoreductase